MTIERIRVYTQDGKTQDFVTPTPNLYADHFREHKLTPPKFQEGDLVRYIDPVTKANPIPYGRIGVVRVRGKPVTDNIGVEWAGWTGGHDLSPFGRTRHSRESGWFVSSESIEYAT